MHMHTPSLPSSLRFQKKTFFQLFLFDVSCYIYYAALRAFKIMMCLGIFNSMEKVPTVLIVADRAGCQPKEAKSMES